MLKKSVPPADSPPPWQSHLEPFRAEIWHWRRSGKTYRAIEELLRREKRFETTFSTVRKFVEARKRRFAELDLPPAPVELTAGEGTVAVLTPQSTAAVTTADKAKAPQATAKDNAVVHKTGARGLPLGSSQEVIGSDQMGHAVTRNKPFRGTI